MGFEKWILELNCGRWSVVGLGMTNGMIDAYHQCELSVLLSDGERRFKIVLRPCFSLMEV
jgi:hypothetical protein